ncbi:unnamed protein product [Rhodiola kirilowii]
MASGSSGRVNSPSQEFDFGSDDVLCTYDDFNGQEGINGTNHTDSVMKADFDLGLFQIWVVSELERKEEREEKFFNGEEEREIKKLRETDLNVTKIALNTLTIKIKLI